MRVVLVIPPSGFLVDERVFPSLGVLKVAAALEETHVHVMVWDFSGVTDLRAAVSDQRLSGDVDVYGITATMPQMPAAAVIANLIRAQSPQSRLVLGGPHVTLLGSSAKLETQRGHHGRASQAFQQLREIFDVLVLGDGERAIIEALTPDALDIIDADDAASPLFLKHGELEYCPLPARHLIDIASYHYQIDGVQTQSLIAQLGCPFGCAFCGGRRSPFLRRVRTRDVSHVIGEMRHLYETYGTRGFMFLDDELNVNPAYLSLLHAICDLQADLGVDFRLRGLLKSELVTEPMAQTMYQAGFRQVLVGFESGDDQILLNMQKRATVAQNTTCVSRLRRHGITVKALMSFGHPGECDRSIEATRRWLLHVEPDDFDVTIITVYPGTPYYDDAKELTPTVWTYTAANGDRLHMLPVDHFRDVNFYKGIPGNYQSFVYTDDLSREDLVAARDRVESDVRGRLQIAWPSAPAAVQYEHSMGMR